MIGRLAVLAEVIRCFPSSSSDRESNYMHCQRSSDSTGYDILLVAVVHAEAYTAVALSGSDQHCELPPKA